MVWNKLAERVLNGHKITKDEALSVLRCPDDQLLSLMDAAYKIRRRYHGKKVRIHILQNAKSGACKENCAFCSQSVRYKTNVERYRTQTVDELVQGAHRAWENGAMTYCMVTATRGPSKMDIETLCEAVEKIKREYPLKICTSLGLLTEESAAKLKKAGVDRYNHNLESSKSFFPEVCSSHSWEDRWNTLSVAKKAGMEACAGGIMGMGESEEDRVELALSLRELGVESVPVNLLNPRPGTPFGELTRLSPTQALKALCMFRFAHPDKDVRVAGGREVILGHMQPMALYVANSMFSQGYLTTGGQGSNKDLDMMRQAGFEPVVVGQHPAEERSADGVRI